MYPEPDFQKALVATLTASATLAAAMGGSVRAYDQPPANPTFPFLQISESQIIDDGDICDDDVFQLFATIHVWSRDTGFVETKRITGEVRQVLKAIFPVDNFEIKTAKFENAIAFKDADGISSHGVIVFRYLIVTA